MLILDFQERPLCPRLRHGGWRYLDALSGRYAEFVFATRFFHLRAVDLTRTPSDSSDSCPPEQWSPLALDRGRRAEPRPGREHPHRPDEGRLS